MAVSERILLYPTLFAILILTAVANRKYFTGLRSFVVEHANDFDLLSAFQRRNRRRGNAEGTKRKLELFFEMAVPPAESFGFVVAVHDDFVPDSFLACFVNLRRRAIAFLVAPSVWSALWRTSDRLFNGLADSMKIPVID